MHIQNYTINILKGYSYVVSKIVDISDFTDSTLTDNNVDVVEVVHVESVVDDSVPV